MPVTTYRPWGHLKKWPQWLRTILLGEGPVFYLLKEVKKWETLGESHRNRLKVDIPLQITSREKTIDNTRELIKSCLAIVAFLSAGVIFAFSQRPQGSAAVLAVITAGFNALAVIVLLRAIIPPPYQIFKGFVHPFEWIPDEAKRWTNCEDEEFLAGAYAKLLDLNSLAAFNKRCLIIGAALTGVGQVFLFRFLWVWLL